MVFDVGLVLLAPGVAAKGIGILEDRDVRGVIVIGSTADIHALGEREDFGARLANVVNRDARCGDLVGGCFGLERDEYIWRSMAVSVMGE